MAQCNRAAANAYFNNWVICWLFLLIDWWIGWTRYVFNFHPFIQKQRVISNLQQFSSTAKFITWVYFPEWVQDIWVDQLDNFIVIVRRVMDYVFWTRIGDNHFCCFCDVQLEIVVYTPMCEVRYGVLVVRNWVIVIEKCKHSCIVGAGAVVSVKRVQEGAKHTALGGFGVCGDGGRCL